MIVRGFPQTRVVDDEQARDRFGTARVARLGTADAAGLPHLVPITFALAGDLLFSAVDAKPKTTTALRRLANISANPHVTVLVDHYTEDWDALWWVRADGVARVLEPADPVAADGIALLVGRYPQYRLRPPAGPVVLVDVRRWSSWSATG